MKPVDPPPPKKRRVAGDESEPSARELSQNGTALEPAHISAEDTYRIAVIGFWYEPKVLPGVLADAYERIFDGHDGPQGTRIALHAGYVAGRNPWPSGTEEACAAARKHDVAVLFEAKTQADRAAYRAYARKKMLPVEIYQRFVDSQQANADRAMVTELIDDCRPGQQRTINLAGLPVGLLVCGENNVFTNAQNDGNRAFVRHQPDATLFDGVPVTFNGAHTNMGNWGKLDQRLKRLSAPRRWAFYATNCDNDAWGSSTVRGYYNEELVADSSMRDVAPPPGVKVERVLDDGPNDRYLALVFDIPGRLLV